MLPLHRSPQSLHAHAEPCAAIDVQAELRFWEDCYTRLSFHQPGVPFRHYVPTLKFAYDTYLLANHDSLDELLPALPGRYEQQVLRTTQLDWPVAQDIVRQVWQRLHGPLHRADPPLLPPLDMLDERSIVAAAMQRA